MTPEHKEAGEIARRSPLARTLDAVERFLGSRILSDAAFAILSHKLIIAAGFQLDEWILAMILYINFSTRIEAMSDRAILQNEAQHDSR